MSIRVVLFSILVCLDKEICYFSPKATVSSLSKSSRYRIIGHNLLVFFLILLESEAANFCLVYRFFSFIN